MADTITAKSVRIVVPAGVTINYAGQTGDSHRVHYLNLPVSIIKKLLERGAKVYEVKDVEVDHVATIEEVELTLENAETDNGGRAVPADATLTVDVEDEVAEKHAEEAEARMEAIGLEIKAQQEAIAKEALGTTTVEGGGEDPVVPPAPGPDLPGVDGPTLTEEEGGSL